MAAQTPRLQTVMTVRKALDYLILGILSTFSNIAIKTTSRKEILLQSMLITFICWLFNYCAAANKNTTSFQSLFLTCHARQPQHNTNYNYLIEVR